MGEVTRPWEEFPHIWKSEAAFLAYVRGGIRKALWNKNPIKLEYLKRHRLQVPNPVAKNAKRYPTVWGGKCEICGEFFAARDMEVDHKHGYHSLRSLEDIQSFFEGIVCVAKDGLQLVCKPCHAAKTLSERSGLSIDEARITKAAIAIQKGDDKAWLKKQGIVPASNAKKRREQIIEKLKGGV